MSRSSCRFPRTPADQQVDELVRRLAADNTFDDPYRTAHILEMLHDNGAAADIAEQVDDLIRRAIAVLPSMTLWGLRRLLRIPRTMGARQ